ncbi:MAG TPA: acetate--CoA ligase family protein [Thermoanaerobaculia bacterium]|nr:acetate--CoA ligase family protein [Thermoanaerobaculia bacterium]HUM30937.1 acetate--CoA ligase family protein [Thermoanaerobaculia bacterium]HXK69270.1 acetate--CoA ligase family protein [Thermoanaerobaculia bacterium]
MSDFTISKFQAYRGPNFYLNRQALVFNLYIDPDGPGVDHYRKAVVDQFPNLKECTTDTVAEFFVHTLMEVLRMEIDLYLTRYSLEKGADDYVVAVEYLDADVATDAVHLVRDWFSAMTDNQDFPFRKEFEGLQKAFDRTYFGGPTFYSLYEAGLKRDIPLLYLFEEGQFMWGYGKKQIRGRSTTVSTDGIKDTEFTMYKDMVGDFLEMCGFPTPKGYTCFSVEEAVKRAEELTFPVVVKPVAGHKGQGVTTNIRSTDEVRKAYNAIAPGPDESEFAGILVQEQVEGTDHRLLAVGSRCVAALERVPAYVDGNGRDSIEKLIEVENDTVARLDNARSPLCKIKIDDDLRDFLHLQNLTLSSVPREGERITLRRVANISAGGVSINVTDKIHPDNLMLVEDIASYFKVTCLGIDVLARDISKSWRDGNFGIIEINAGPGVFMHLAPALGGSIDVPGEIMKVHFPRERYERVPILSGHSLTRSLCDSLEAAMKEVKKDLFIASLTEEGVHFNGRYFHKNADHDQNVKIILRQPRLDVAIFNHTKNDIWDYGMVHQGADIVILDNPGTAESVLARDLMDDGFLVTVEADAVVVKQAEQEKARVALNGTDAAAKEKAITDAVRPLLPDFLNRYL